jgi:hypothetical protein
MAGSGSPSSQAATEAETASAKPAKEGKQ